MLVRSPAISLLLALTASGSARAQGPVYLPSAPTPGALYRDGASDRYLLGGTWLYRADPADIGLAAGLFRDVGSTDGWTPVAVPNAYNAGDTSNASMLGTVG